MAKKMVITIGLDGQTSVKVEGGVGANCEEFTRAVERAVGQVEERVFLPEHDLDELHVSLDQQVTESDGL